MWAVCTAICHCCIQCDLIRELEQSGAVIANGVVNS